MFCYIYTVSCFGGVYLYFYTCIFTSSLNNAGFHSLQAVRWGSIEDARRTFVSTESSRTEFIRAAARIIFLITTSEPLLCCFETGNPGMCLQEKRDGNKQTEHEFGFWPLKCMFQWRWYIPKTKPHDLKKGGVGEWEHPLLEQKNLKLSCPLSSPCTTFFFKHKTTQTQMEFLQIHRRLWGGRGK